MLKLWRRGDPDLSLIYLVEFANLFFSQGCLMNP
nr:MAG TPA_asm: hypothetical protein [Bacteriophage sp.]